MSETSAAPAVAVITIRQTTPTSKWLGAVDPKTQRPIAAGDQVVLCPKCYTPQLLSSWHENGDKCAIDETPGRAIERATRGAGGGGAAAGAAAPAAPAQAAPAAAPAPAAAQPAAQAAAAPAPAAAAAAVPAEPIDPYKYALPVDAPTESSVWAGNIMTIVVLLIVWGLIVLGYTLLVVFGVLPGAS